MSKRSFRVSALSACMILGLSLAGCGNSETKTEQSTTAATEATSATERVTDAKTEAASATEKVTEQATEKASDTQKKEDVSVESLTTFEVTTTSIENGEWKQSTGGKLDNKSPELSWDAVDGAAMYAVIMLDKDARNWLHWYVTVDKTHLEEGEFSGREVGYIGPYPPKTHEYEVYVVALAGKPEKADFKLDGIGADINFKLGELDVAADGSSGNVLAYGMIAAKFTPAE